MTESAPNLPSYALWNGHATCLEVCEPGWLYAGWLTELDGDRQSRRFTYRSPMVRPESDLHQRMLDFVDGAASIGEAQTITDPDMMFGRAEFTLHELRPLGVTA
jgi:hypothetical protein